MTNIFVSNLSFRINDEDLKTAFAEYGAIKSAKVIIDKISGRSRGFGFVEMENDEEATKAIEELNNAEFDGKVMTVSEARPRTDAKPAGRTGGGFNRGGSGGGYGDRDRGSNSGGGSGFKKRY